MPNNFERIIQPMFARGLQALRENAIVARLVNTNWAEYEAMQGDTINVPIPSAATATDVSPSYVPPQPASSTPRTVPIVLNQWKKSDMYLTDKQAREVVTNPRDLQITEHIKVLVNTVDAYVLNLYRDVYGFAGTAGTSPFGTKDDISALLNARKTLNDQLAPKDPRYALLDTRAENDMLASRVFQDAGFRRRGEDTTTTGEVGRAFGFNFFMDQNIPTHDNSGGAGFLVNGELAAGSSRVTVDGGLDVPSPGDIFTVANDTQTYVVKATPGPTATAWDFAPASKEAWADNAAITFKADHVVNLLFHRDAFALATRPLPAADGFLGGNMMMQGMDELSGLNLSLEVSREHYQTRYSWSILYGATCVRPELATRLAG